MTIETDTRKALRELIDLLTEIDQRWAAEEWNLTSAADVVGAHRALMHLLEGGIANHFEYDRHYPQFRRIVTPNRKFTGDNADAIYFEAAVDPGLEYRVRGNMAGAVYMSLTVEVGTDDGSMGTRTAAVLNNSQFNISADGDFELRLGGTAEGRNCLSLQDASSVTVRYYFEETHCVAADPTREPVISIEALEPGPVPAPANEQSVARGIRRVAEFVRSRTLGMPPMASQQQPDFVSLVPNQFPPPVLPGDFALSAHDAHYSMAPYYLAPDQALVITGRWPTRCAFANVSLWNRFQQTYDYQHRTVSLNRKQTKAEADGSFRIILAHQDPGAPNWLDTEGAAFGLVFWRYFLAEEAIETPCAEVVSFASIALPPG